MVGLSRKQRPGVRPHRALPLVEVEAVDEAWLGLNAVARQQILDHITAGAEHRFRRHDMIARFQRRENGGRHRRHSGCSRAAGFGTLEFDHAPFEHRNRRVGIARIDVAGVFALEARLAQLGGVVDITLGEKQRLGRFAEFRAQGPGVNQAGLGAVVSRGSGRSRRGFGCRLGHVTS